MKYIKKLLPFLFLLILGFSCSVSSCEGGKAISAADTIQAEESDSKFENPERGVEIAANRDKEDGEGEDALCAYICGAVLRPDVYSCTRGERVVHLLRRAGGFADDAAKDSLNLARPVQDGEMIYVPNQEEWAEQKMREERESTDGSGSKTININTADRKRLETLPGIGAHKAEQIIEYRNAHGKFKTIDEMKQIPGIKEKGFEKIKELIAIE